MAKVRIENGKLIIELPLGTPTISGTGKTLNVATTNGFMPTTAEVNGKQVRVNVNAIIAK